MTRAWYQSLLITPGSNLGCPVAGSGVGSSCVSPALAPQPLPLPCARKARLCKSHTIRSSQEKISNANSNYILGPVGPWRDLGSCLVGVTWLNSAVSFGSVGKSLGLIALQVHKAWNEVFKNPHMICSGSRDQHPNTLRHLAYFFSLQGKRISNIIPNL